MRELEEQAKTFGMRKEAGIANARQMAAMSLACGIDLAAALGADTTQRIRWIRQVERVLERERLKGMRRHWSYDLNRHIALKQALDRLREAAGDMSVSAEERPAPFTNSNGARRRRRI